MQDRYVTHPGDILIILFDALPFLCFWKQVLLIENFSSDSSLKKIELNLEFDNDNSILGRRKRRNTEKTENFTNLTLKVSVYVAILSLLVS